MTISITLAGLCCLAGTLAWGLRLFHKWKGRPLADRLLAAVLPCGAFIAAACIVRHVLYSPFPNWNAARLASAAAMARGYPLYAGRDHGVLMSSLHAPFSSIAYLPATVAPNPTLAVILGVMLSLGFTLGPAIWILSREQRRVHSTSLIRLAAVVCFVLICVSNFSLNYTVFWIRADNPVIGLVASSGAVLALRKNRATVGPLLASAILAILAVWTKQTFAPALAALLLYVLLLDGWRVLLKYAACLLGAGAALSGLFLGFFPVRDMALNTLIVPSLHPWKSADCISAIAQTCAHVVDLAGKLRTLGAVAAQLLEYCLIFPLVGLPLILAESAASGNCTRLRVWIEGNRWAVFALTGIVLVPVALINQAKAGGEPSSYAASVYFLALCMVLLLVRTSVIPATETFSRTLLATTIALLACLSSTSLPSLPKIVRELHSNPQQMAYNYAKAHPGEAYFPWNPLSVLMAEGKAYHFEFAIYDRDLAQMPPSQSHFREGVPARFQLVAFPPYPHEWQPRLVLRYLPTYVQQPPGTELPGWTVYARR